MIIILIYNDFTLATLPIHVRQPPSETRRQHHYMKKSVEQALPLKLGEVCIEIYYQEALVRSKQVGFAKSAFTATMPPHIDNCG